MIPNADEFIVGAGLFLFVAYAAVVIHRQQAEERWRDDLEACAMARVCPHCGYDLSGVPVEFEGGLHDWKQCPECGKHHIRQAKPVYWVPSFQEPAR